MRRLKILAWDSHGRYLRLLSRLAHDFYVLARPGVAAWAPNVHLLAAGHIRRQRLDLLLFQDEREYLDDQYELLSPAQRGLPSIYLEHDPPREHPVDSRHVAQPDALLVHVSDFNRLMWDSGASPTRVIEPGLPDPGARYSGERARGLAALEGLARGGRRLGLDLYRAASRSVALELGEAPDGRYRFFFHPARHASPGLELVEAMMIGMPVLAPASAGMAGVVRDGESGFVDADPARLLAAMKALLRDRGAAAALGREARRDALERFSFARFAAGWNEAFAAVAGRERFAA